jgi:hypothetical protein
MKFVSLLLAVTALAFGLTADARLGSEGGGGGFGDENSNFLLTRAKSFTSGMIRKANPGVFENLPNKWTQERLARLIENIHSEPNTIVYRYDRELMFDYKTPEKGEPYLVATSLFFRAHSSVPTISMTQQDLGPYLQSIRVMLLHEAAHVLGIGTTEKSNYKARVFALDLLYRLASNNISCKVDQLPLSAPSYLSDPDLIQRIQEKYSPNWDPRNPDEIDDEISESKQLGYAWVLNRPTSFAVQTQRSHEAEVYFKYIDDIGSNGIPGIGDPFLILGMRSMNSSERGPAEFFPNEQYLPPDFFLFNNIGVLTQYFPNWSVKSDTSYSVGGSNPFRHNDNSDCELGEDLLLPLNGNGHFGAKLHYHNTCFTNTRTGETIKVSGDVELACQEYYLPVLPFDEFHGEGSFTHNELLDWAKQVEDGKVNIGGL